MAVIRTLTISARFHLSVINFTLAAFSLLALRRCHMRTLLLYLLCLLVLIKNCRVLLTLSPPNMQPGQKRCLCGHVTAEWDTHVTKCRSCCGCSRLLPCGISKAWSPEMWEKVESARTHVSRRGKSSKTGAGRVTKKAASTSQAAAVPTVGPLDIEVVESLGTPEKETPQTRSQLGVVSQPPAISVRLIKTTVKGTSAARRAPVTSHRSPVILLLEVTGHESSCTGHRSLPVTGHRPPVTSHRSDRDPPVTGQFHRSPVTTGHRSSSTGHRSPVTSHYSSDRASSHDTRAGPSSDCDRRSASRVSRDSASQAPSHSSKSRRRSSSRHSGGRHRSRHGTGSRHRSSSRRRRRERYDERSHAHRHGRRHKSRSPSPSPGVSWSSSPGSFSGFSNSPSPRSYISRKRPHSRGSPHSVKRSRGGQESATLQRMEQFMQQFASNHPSETVTTGPPQTVTSEQGTSGVDPVVPRHQDTPDSGSVVVPAVSEEAHRERDSDDESEAPPASFLETIKTVYRWLPEDKCPKMDLPPPMVRSLFEGVAPVSKEMPKLPFSPTVGLLVNEIEGHLEEDGRRSGTYVPKKFMGRTARFYRPHNSAWPVKPPVLDKDARLIGIDKAPVPAPSVSRVWENTDVRLRQIVAMASHIDLCRGGV